MCALLVSARGIVAGQARAACECASHNPPVLSHVVGHQSPAFASNPERGIDKSAADCSRKASAADPG
jgi:hypothetical protein